jgi:hypothetical protein
MKPVILVSCVSKKLNQPAPAKDLYQSTWFRLARRYAERFGDRWFILSAKHGLLLPDQEIEPYEMTLNTMSRKQRLDWARRVYHQIALGSLIPQQEEIVILAGYGYRQYLELYLLADGYTVKHPLSGLGIGQQQRWLKEQAQHQMEKK